MKRFTVSLFVLGLIAACSQGENETTTENAPLDNSKEEVVVEEAVLDEEVSAYTMEDFPKSWIRLEEQMDGPFYIMEWCGAETPSLKITAGKGENWDAEIQHGQEVEFGTIQNFSATEMPLFNYSIIEGSFDFFSKDGDKREVVFSFDENSRACSFKGLLFDDFYFAPKSDKNRFDIVVEECPGVE